MLRFPYNIFYGSALCSKALQIVEFSNPESIIKLTRALCLVVKCLPPYLKTLGYSSARVIAANNFFLLHVQSIYLEQL